MLQEKLKEIKQEVDSFLKEFFAEKKKKIGAVHPEIEKLIADIENVTLRGGDRFRPFMVYLGAILTNTNQYYQILSNTNKGHSRESGDLSIRENPLTIRENQSVNKINEVKNKEELIKLMCATELLHSFALIHDDIIDRAETRRGGPTIKPDEKAILAGDLCFVFADELLNGMPVSVKEIYDELREEVIAGEWLDVWTSSKFKSLSRSAKRDQKSKLRNILNTIYEYKTARYSFEKPFMMGMKYAGGHGGPLLQNILIKIGLAFQVKDDYLDLFGDDRLGKKIGGDLKEGKLTMFHVKLMEKMKDRPDALSLQKKYENIFGNKNLTDKDIEWIKKIIIELGIKNEVEEEMKRISDEAKGMIEEIKELKGEARQLLIEMAEFVVEREY